jgi:hypothetical protein
MMLRMIARLALLLTAFSLAVPATAKPDAEAEFRQVKSLTGFTIRPDRAYLLLRIDTSSLGFGPALMRIPEQSELDAYDAARRGFHAKAGPKAGPIESFNFDYQGRPNLFLVAPKTAIGHAGKTHTVLVEATPGDYVFYGIGGVYECFCMGTVGFAATAGQVTDLGTMITDMAWKPSTHPELAGEVDLGPSAVMDYGLFASAVRPPKVDDALPAGLDPTMVHAARYFAVGAFTEPGANLANRLAPMPGVLAYREGRVVDVRTGAEVPPNFR